MEKLRKLYYDLPGLDYGPRPDDFVVSFGQRGVGTVYHVAESRRSPTRNRYNLKVYVANDLKAETRIQRVPHRWIRRTKLRNRRRIRSRITVRGIHAWAIFWYPRNKKNAPA